MTSHAHPVPPVGPTPPRVAVWTESLLPASETFIRNQADALRSWQMCLHGLVRVTSPLACESDTVIYGPGLPGRVRRRAATITGVSPRVRRALVAFGPALVHVHFVSGCAYLVARNAASHGVPVIVTAHGADVTTPQHRAGPRGIWRRARIRATLGQVSLVIAVSEYIRQKLLELGADPAKVVVHHIGIPVPPPPRIDVVKHWDVAFVGRFVEKKGVLDLIGALARLGPELRPRCVFIGDGPLLGPAREAAEAAGINAAFLGSQPPSAVQATLQEARVFAAPSRTAKNGDAEGLPTVLLEAAAAGLPVAATRHSGIPEAVLDGQTGLLSPEGDVEALAANLRRLLSSPELRVRLGAAGRAHVEREFDIVKQTAVLEKIYDAVAYGERVIV